MSMMFSPSLPTSRTNLGHRLVCARLLGEHIRVARTRDGRPLEKIAPMAALTVPEWEAIEAGQVPDTWEQICLIAEALHLGRSWRAYLAQLYERAWTG